MSFLNNTGEDTNAANDKSALGNLDHMCDIGHGRSFYTEYMRGNIADAGAKKKIEDLTDEELVNLFVKVPLCHKLEFLLEIEKREIKTVVVDLEGHSSRDDFLKRFGEQVDFVFVDGMDDLNIFEAIDEIVKSYPSVKMLDIGQSYEKIAQSLNNCDPSKQEKKLPFHQVINTAFNKRKRASKY